MADEIVAQTGANPAEVPPTPVTAEPVATPPSGEQPGAKTVSENRVPQSRFSEVVKERNRERELREQYESKIRDMESRLAGAQPKQNEDADADRLVAELGMDKDAAKKLLGTVRSVSQKQNEAVQMRLRQFEIAEWERNMRSKYKDYDQLGPSMEKVFNSLSPDAQRLAVADPMGLELLYSRAKIESSEKVAEEAFQRGAESTRASTDLKKALSSAPGSGTPAPKAPLSAESIASMDIKTYKERLPEINEWLKSR